jgi:hypothetical protein
VQIVTLKDFIPFKVKRIPFLLAACLGMGMAGSNLYAAFKTGVAQRVPDSRRYTRRENPVMFWILVSFFALSLLLFGSLLVAGIIDWVHDKE